MKTIDVQDGDTWTAHVSEFELLQHRDGKHRHIRAEGYSRWQDNCASWEPIPSWMAHDAIARMGYAITKPEPVITKRHGPVETVMVTAADDLAATVKRLEEKMNSIAKDATSLAAPIKTLEERMNDIAKSVTYMQDRVSRIGERLSAVGGRVAKLEAATPAKVRVVAPMMILPGAYEGREPLLLKDLDARWRAALSAAGVEVKEASNGKA